MRVATFGAGKISYLLQEARWQDDGGTIKRGESKDDIGKLFEGAVNDAGPRLEPLLPLTYAFEEGILQVSSHKGIMAFGIRVMQLGEENKQQYSRHTDREKVVPLLQLVVRGFHHGVEHVDGDGRDEAARGALQQSGADCSAM